MTTSLNKSEQKAMLAGCRFMSKYCAKGHSFGVENGIIRCLEPSKCVIIEVNLRLALGDLTLTIQGGSKTPQLLKGLTNTDGNVFVSATDDLTLFGDADSTVHLPRQKSDVAVKYLPLFEIERRYGVDFNDPLVSVSIDKRTKHLAASTFKANRQKLIDIHIHDGMVELSVEVSPDTLVESKMPIVWPGGNPPDIAFRVPVKHLCRIPVNSLLRVFKTNLPENVMYELSGAIHKNPLVPFRIMGTAPILNP